MTITSRYDSICKRCGGKISRGEKIEWTRGEGARHLECPAEPEKAEPSYGQSFTARRGGGRCADCNGEILRGQAVRFRYPGKKLCHADCDTAAEAAAQRKAEAPYSLSGGSGYGCEGWNEGQVRRSSQRLQDDKGYPEYLYVVEAGHTYHREDGMSFGVGDESGYTYWARCREATEEEAAPLKAEIERQQKEKAARQRLGEIKKHVQGVGERPDPEQGQRRLDGETVLNSRTPYGGGDWWVIASDAIWYVRNNGNDGDCWAHNNVETGGAGAVGWYVPYTDDLAAELRELAATLS